MMNQKIDQKIYPDPFFDMSRLFMPKTIVSLFKYCRIFYYKNEFLHNLVRKLAVYPITNIIIEEYENENLKKVWENVFKVLKIKKKLTEIGLSYTVFGNSLVSLNVKFRRYLKCPECEHISLLNQVDKLRFSGFKYMGVCRNCKKTVSDFEINDQIKEGEGQEKSIHLIQWRPEQLQITVDEYTGEHFYRYNLDASTKKGIEMGNLEIVNRSPKIFIEAVKKKRSIDLNEENLFHLKQPALPEADGGWGKPMILPALMLIYYMQTLRRGNEAIALEHIVPLRVLFPPPTGSTDPIGMVNSIDIGEWKSHVEESIEAWKKDPNHIMLCPIPLGSQTIGGDARALMVTPELRFTEEAIINSFGVPIEFAKGGANWNMGSVSSRLVENAFLSYREDLLELMNEFLIPQLSKFLKIDPVKVSFSKLKLHDDIAEKNLYLALNNSAKISDTHLLEELGIDPIRENKMRENELLNANSHKKKVAIGEAEAQSAMMEIQARGQVRAKHAMADENSKIEEEVFMEELIAEQSQSQHPGTQEVDPSVIIKKYAIEMLSMDKTNRDRIFKQMVQEGRVHTARAIDNKIKALSALYVSLFQGEEENA